MNESSPRVSRRDGSTIEISESLPLGHFVQVLRRYRHAMAVALTGVALVCVLLMVAAILLSPRQSITTLPFRFEFEGSELGRYPNNVRFSSSEVVSTPILLQVFRTNGLQRFTSFKEFSDSIFVIETNRALEELSRQYAARLSDPKLNPVDRERLEGEYREKRNSLDRSEYSLNFVQKKSLSRIPPSMARKTLSDILSTWADSTVKQKGVLRYRAPVLSRNILTPEILQYDPMVTADVLRSRAKGVMRNIESLLRIPGSEVLKARGSGRSLPEIRVHLNDILRYQLQPLILRLAAGHSDSPGSTRGFVEAQLEYNDQQAKTAESRAEAFRETLQLYTQQRRVPVAETQGLTGRETPVNPTGEALMPQISESFLDRIIELSNERNDREYRQQLVADIRSANLESVPFREEAVYYRDLLQQVSTGASTMAPVEVGSIRQKLEDAYRDLGVSIDQINDIYNLISANLNPPAALYSVTGPASSRAEYGMSIRRIGLYILLLFLISVPVIIGAVLLHARARAEESMGIEMEEEPIRDSARASTSSFPEREASRALRGTEPL